MEAGVLSGMRDVDAESQENQGNDNDLDAAAAASIFNSSLTPDEPVITPPEDGHLVLQYGYEHDGELYRTAEVRELRGKDEEAISKLRGSGALYYARLEDLVVRRATVRIGEFTPADTKGLTASLLLGDRGLLFAHIMLATFGPTKEYEHVPCPHCKELNDFEVDWFDILDIEPMKGELPQSTVTLKDGMLVEIMFPRGEDQLEVLAEDTDATDAEINTKMLTRCIANDNIPNKLKFVQDLPMKDRRNLVQAIDRDAPKVGFKECEVPCPSCEEPIKFGFGWDDLLRL